MSSDRPENPQADLDGSTTKGKTAERRTTAVTESTLRSGSTILDAVGGHQARGVGVAWFSKHGHIYKPMQDGMRGRAELEFYQTLFGSDNPLKQHVPHFSGTEKDDAAEYLVLGDLCAGYTHPCVLDLKMGTQTYDEKASQDKIDKEIAKYKWQSEIGFRVIGMKKYVSASGEMDRPEASTWGRGLTPKDIRPVLERFLCSAGDRRTVMIERLVEQLRAIRRCLTESARWRITSSSLLITYEGADGTSHGAERGISVHMIDFAHVFEITDGGVDAGYMHGLDTLLSHLNQILKNTE